MLLNCYCTLWTW